MTNTSSLSAQYHDSGYLSGMRVFESDRVAGYRSEFERIEREIGKERCQIGILDWHFQEPFVWEMATDPKLLDLVEQAVGPDLYLIATHFFCKYPDTGENKQVDWHQDVTYWGLEPPEAHTAWIALDDADSENGSMQVLPGSHTRGILPHGTSSKEGNLLSVNQGVNIQRFFDTEPVCLEYRAGEMSLHDGLLLHASYPNRSQRRRCGLTVRFVEPHVRFVQQTASGKGQTPILVRGEDRFHRLTPAAAPFDLSARNPLPL